MNVQEIDASRYLVTLDRDGTALEYEFEIREGPLSFIDPPERFYYELIDYQSPATPGFSQGMFDIPLLRVICKAVDRVSEGKPVELPMVLDER